MVYHSRIIWYVPVITHLSDQQNCKHRISKISSPTDKNCKLGDDDMQANNNWVIARFAD